MSVFISTPPTDVSASPPPADGLAPSRSAAVDRQPVRHRRRWAAAAVGVVLVAAAVAVAAANPFAKGGAAPAGVTDNAYPTSLATVSRQDLTSQTTLNATLGYAGTYNVVNQAQGIVTSLPAVGQVISQGQVLYQVNGKPVVLLYGSTPAFRSLAQGASGSDVTGPDVAELNADLVALGYATSAEIPAGSDQFSSWTKTGVKKLQAAVGETQDGTLALGQVVFLPAAARITAVSAALGGPAQPGSSILSATATTRLVTIALDASQQAEVKVGDKVTITLPNNQTTPGVISSIGTVATAPPAGSQNSTPTVPVAVTPTDPGATGSYDQAPVEVSITQASVSNVLVVPVDALVALAGGGYAVEVVDPDSIHHLVGVSVGLFDDADGLVQVSGSGLTAGQKVVVPTR